MVWPISYGADNSNREKTTAIGTREASNPTGQQIKQWVAQTSKQRQKHTFEYMYTKTEGGCIHVFCKLCILLAILGLTPVVYYLRDKGLLGRTQEVQRNLLPDISVFLKLALEPTPPLPSPRSNFLSRLSLGSLHSTGASSSWGGVPFSIKNPSICLFPKTFFLQKVEPLDMKWNLNMKFGRTCCQHKRSRSVCMLKHKHELK